MDSPPPKKTARCSHATFMSSTVCQSPQAQHLHVTNAAPVGAEVSHACANSPSTHPPLHPYTHIFSSSVMGCPQIITPSLGGAGMGLDIGRLAMRGFTPDQLFNSKPSLKGCVESWCACTASPWVLRTITVGYTLQFAHPLPGSEGWSSL